MYSNVLHPCIQNNACIQNDACIQNNACIQHQHLGGVADKFQLLCSQQTRSNCYVLRTFVPNHGHILNHLIQNHGHIFNQDLDGDAARGGGGQGPDFKYAHDFDS